MSLKKSLKLVMSYDIICPHSWVGYQVSNSVCQCFYRKLQILQKKLPTWRSHRQIIVEYEPAIHTLIHKVAYGVQPAGLITAKKSYLLNELNRISEFYDIPSISFDINFKQMENRSLSALLLLIKLKRDMPEYYEKMMQAMWQEFWCRSGKVNRTTIFLRLGREIGIPFHLMDSLLMHIENRPIYTSLIEYTRHLCEDERILGCPWFILRDETEQKILSFGDIIRFEMLDEIIPLDDINLENLMPIPEEENLLPNVVECDQKHEDNELILFQRFYENNKLRKI